MNFCLDTTLLIDVERELRRQRGAAIGFMEKHADAALFVSAVAWAEFLEGSVSDKRASVNTVREMLTILPVFEETASAYAVISSRLRAQGNPIDANDMWIAATAITNQMPLVTRNQRDFSRISELKLLTY